MDQINYYFDTSDLKLTRSRTLLRIRKAGECVLTLKCGKEVRPGFFDALELESRIPSASLAALVEEPQAILELAFPAIDELKRRFGKLEISLLGTLHNERVQRTIDGLVLEVDRVAFPDGSELYELEIETDEISRAEAWVERRLLSRGLCLRPQRFTKLEELLSWRRAGGAEGLRRRSS
jgi:uncharacterized protein YjbK